MKQNFLQFNHYPFNCQGKLTSNTIGIDPTSNSTIA